ncbi:MAG: hypothetical protein HOI95_26625 [Chromatiales bacterium]|jgi:crotonobetainyl-CoA:carnitine CoA-transferase CaiB-like acyl-CoA transferase|nr:hypothetical protein [Chromatiales bacterium]
MSSFVGMESLVGYPDEDPMGALNFALSDPSASIHGLAPLLAALRRARHTGKGSYIDLSQLEVLLGTLRPYLIAAQMSGQAASRGGNAHTEFSPHGIYPAMEDDTWLTIAVTNEREWQAFRVITHSCKWATSPRFSTGEMRLANADELDVEVANWTCTRVRDELVDELRAAGIASSPVLSLEEQWRDPHYDARGLKASVDIPYYGSASLFRAPWKFSEYEPNVSAPGPTTGCHKGS